MNRIYFLIILPFAIALELHGQNYKDSLSFELEKLVNESEIPGFGVSVVGIDSVLYKNGFGYSNIKDKTEYNTGTIQNIGSITKTTIAVSIMQLVENGKLKLDDNINQFLPFEITNPYHPSKVITIRHLATHTSSLTDGEDDMTLEKTYLFRDTINFTEDELPKGYFEYFQIYKTNQKMSMTKFLHDTYCKNGNWYAKANFLNKPPGTEYQYSNLGAALLALIIEELTGEKFSKYTKEEIFDKLDMKNTYWDLDKVPENHIASLYMSNGLKIPQYSLITYPDGGLYTSIEDFSKYLNEMIKGINGKGKLLSHNSYKEMLTNQLILENFPHYKSERTKGILWDVNMEGDNISANGTDPGIDTYLLFTTGGNVGIVMFKNSNSYGNERMEKDFLKIRSILFKYIPKMLN